MIATTKYQHPFAMKRSNDELGGSGSASEQSNKRNRNTGLTAGSYDEERFEEQQQQRFSSAQGGHDDGHSFLSQHLGNLYMVPQGQLNHHQGGQPTTNAHGVQMLLDEINRTQQQEAVASNLLAQARMNSASASTAADSMFFGGNNQQLLWPTMPTGAAAARMPAYSNMNLHDSLGQSEGMMDPLTMAAIAQMNRFGAGGGGEDSLLAQQQQQQQNQHQQAPLSIQALLQHRAYAPPAVPQDPYMALLMQSMAASGGASFQSIAAAALMGGNANVYGTQLCLPIDQQQQLPPMRMLLDSSGSTRQSSLGSAPAAPRAAAAAASSRSSSSTDGIPLSLPSDENNLSEYQCLLRAQIDLFAATSADIDGNAQGRNKPIVLGQVGIRCRHCHMNPSTSRRARGAVYFPAKLSGLYQAAQNMAINHFTESCRHLGQDTREKLARLKERKSYKLGGGKGYWATGARIRHVCEVDNRLYFEDKKPKAAATASDKNNNNNKST